uniref:ferredoxin:thioredoxin reductase n=1 Tax=Fundidesulfovibrio putealis TaxID=270496 RepID=A0A7C4AHY6_9BACT
MTAKELMDRIGPLQEKKGYYFNPDTAMTLELLEMLLVNKERYGHMACPCRLASGNFEMDRDIICPCVYREPDVAEYGTCFCGLYASKEWAQGKLPKRVVPERRPPEKVLAGLGLE